MPAHRPRVCADPGTHLGHDSRSCRSTSGKKIAISRQFPAPPAGFEPATCGLEVRCSIQLSYGGSVANATGHPSRARVRPTRLPRSEAQLIHLPGRSGTLMTKTLTVTLTGLLAALTLLPSTASAKTNVRVGIGDQQVSMFDQPLFKARKFKLVRYFVPWNVTTNKDQLALAKAYVQRARQDHIQVLLHISSDDLRIKKAKLPSVAAYRTQIKRIVSTFRPLGVRDFGTWNEVNHASQPTYRSPTRAADFFVEAYRAIKPRCSFCNVVALDVLDQTGVESYMKTFFRHLSSTYRRRASLVGIHNYGDVNRQRTTFTRNIIHEAHHYNAQAKFWFTETGGIVKFGRSFPCNTTRAAHRINNMFSLARTYRTSGVQRIYVYNWTGAGCSARFDAGLTAPDGTPRAGYDTLRRQLVNFER